VESNGKNQIDRNKMNTIRHQQEDEPARDWRSRDIREDIDLWATDTPPRREGVVGSSRSEKGLFCDQGNRSEAEIDCRRQPRRGERSESNLSGKDTGKCSAEVRVATVVQASHGKTEAGKTGTVEQSRL